MYSEMIGGIGVQGKVIVVTGGANGIGRYLVQAFVERGAIVYCMDKDRQAGERLQSTVRGHCFFYHGDLTNEESMQCFVKQVIDGAGKVDIVINNACFSHRGIMSECSYAQFNEVLRVGVTAPYMLTQLFLAHFSKGASIVNIASTRAMQSQADTESYSAAKGGLLALTHALAVSLAGRVRVNAISPGWIDTGDTGYEPSTQDHQQHPSGRIGTPADIVRAVLFLTNVENDFINGENIVVDGGMSKLMIYHGDAGWTYGK